MKKLALFLNLSLILVLIFPILSQFNVIEKSICIFSQTKDKCSEQINKAQEEYNLGNFQKAIDLIEPCLKKSDISESEKGRGYRLLGLVYIGQQLQKEANDAVRNLLLMVPSYKINPETDPPQLKKIIDEMAPTLVPIIRSINPTSINEGKEGFTLTVKGSNFVYGTQVRFDRNVKNTTFISSVELKAEISKEDISNDGEFSVDVLSPILGGKVSNTETFKVNNTSSFPWTWMAVGGGVVVAAVVAIITLGGSKDNGGTQNTNIADPPSRPN